MVSGNLEKRLRTTDGSAKKLGECEPMSTRFLSFEVNLDVLYEFLRALLPTFNQYRLAHQALSMSPAVSPVGTRYGSATGPSRMPVWYTVTPVSFLGAGSFPVRRKFFASCTAG
jgi:hypothetical protein